MSTIGGRIKYYRLFKQLLQQYVAAKANINICTIIRYEKNQVEHSIDVLKKIASAIGINPFLIYDDYLTFIASNYGNKIKSIRKKFKLTQKEFGNIIGVHRKTIVRWEKEQLVPSRNHYIKLKNFKGGNINEKNSNS